MNKTCIEIAGLTKTFSAGGEKISVLNSLDWIVPRGTIAAVVGESGSGKSTLLNLIGGLDSADAGRIVVDGLEVTALGEEDLSGYRNARIGFIFQFHYLLKDFTSRENVMMPALMAGAGKNEAMKKADELLQAVGMVGRKDSFPAQLSGGERQRIAAARALVNDPAVILADEPTGNLDKKNTLIMEELLLGLCRERGKTMILVTHDTDFAGKADTVLQIEEGRLCPP